MRSDAPQRHRLPTGGLDLSVLEWAGGDTTLLLLHGYLDCGGSFGPLVRRLPPDLHVLAPDLRGHGRSDRVGAGGWYHFPDYARDVKALVDARARERLVVLGHSMGGSVSLMLAGAWPERIERLILVEGLGPAPEEDAEPARLRRWLLELGQLGVRSPKSYPSLDAVADSLRRRYPGIAEAEALEVADALAERDPAAGGWTWRHDPLHRVRSPTPYHPSRYAAFLEAVACPVLLVTGGRSWYRYGDLPERRARLRDRRRLHLPTVGHMVHLEAPDVLGAAVEAFLAGREPEGALRPGRDPGADANEPGDG